MKTRKLILFMIISADGFIGSANGQLDWEMRDEEESKLLIRDLLTTADSMLLGRVLYQGFAQAWPAMASNPKSPKSLVKFAKWIERSPKFVFSKTLKKADWKNTKLIAAKNDKDIITEVNLLKHTSGGDIVMFGGVRIAQTLSRLGLIDEYRLKMQPVILGKGLPLFKDQKGRMDLKLVRSRVFSSGVAALYYQKAKS